MYRKLLGTCTKVLDTAYDRKGLGSQQVQAEPKRYVHRFERVGTPHQE